MTFACRSTAVIYFVGERISCPVGPSTLFFRDAILSLFLTFNLFNIEGEIPGTGFQEILHQFEEGK
jgi:hypothetical protein